MTNPIHTDWKQVKLEEIAKISSGGTPLRSESNYWDGNIPWITTSEIDFNIISEAKQKISEEGLNNSSAKLFERGTLLLAMYGQGKTRGKVAKLDIKASTNQACCAIQINKSNSHDYYFYHLANQYKNIRELSNDGGQKNLSGTIIKRLKVPSPPLLEQHRIVAVLETWDKALEALTRKIQLKKNVKKGLMQELLTGKKRLLGFSGRWQEVKLGDVCKVKKGTSFTKKELIKGDVPVIAGGQQPACYHNQNNREGKIITVSASGAYAGYIDYYEIPIFASDCSTIQGTTADINFIYAILKSKQNWIYHALQTGGAQPHVYPKDLEKLKIIIPELKDEQTAIAQILTTADDEITALEQKKEKLEDQKKYLLNNLITGQIRTPENLTMNNQ